MTIYKSFFAQYNKKLASFSNIFGTSESNNIFSTPSEKKDAHFSTIWNTGSPKFIIFEAFALVANAALIFG